MDARYREYLKSEDWKRLRRHVMKAAGGRCELKCRNRATQVHHLTYKRLYREHPLDLLALCVRCHDALHPTGNDGKRQHLTPRRDFRCRFCPRKFFSSRHTRAHEDAAHPHDCAERIEAGRRAKERRRRAARRAGKLVACSACSDREFLDMQALRQHTKAKHPEIWKTWWYGR